MRHILLSLLLSACGWNAATFGAEGPVVTLSDPPPPVRGGTLVARSDGSELLVVDRDRALIHAASLDGARVTALASWTLSTAARPERALYAEGQRIAILADASVVRLDPDGAITPLGTACAQPRGFAFDASLRTLWASCGDGELVRLPLDGGEATRFTLTPDLGDLVARGGLVWVVHVRSATISVVNAQGVVQRAIEPAPVTTATTVTRDTVLRVTRDDAPQAALRLVDAGDQGIFVLHELMRVGAAQIVPARVNYGQPLPLAVNGPCGTNTTVLVAVSRLQGSTLSAPLVLPQLPYASDMAFDPVRAELAVGGPSTLRVSDWLGPAVWTAPFIEGGCAPDARPASVEGQVSALAYLPSGALAVQTREPASLVVAGVPFALPGASVRDTGHDIFHSSEEAGRAPCIACHIDGGTDGHVWDQGQGPRCTTTMRGGLSNTAPFHWDGSLPDMHALLVHHFPDAGSDTTLAPEAVTAFSHWVDRLPIEPPLPVDPGLVTHGGELFGSLGCASCHGADGHTPISANVDVGQAEPTQVPSLVDLGQQSPLGDNGCAANLEGLLRGACGWDQHAVALPADRLALAAFLGATPPP